MAFMIQCPIFKDRTLCGITNVGYKPTIGEKFLGVETYLFDCEEDLYGEPCRVEFFHYSRPEKRFSVHRSTEAAAPEGCRKGKGLFPQPRKIKTFGKNFSKKQLQVRTVCYTVRGEKASIQKPETPTTS